MHIVLVVHVVHHAWENGGWGRAWPREVDLALPSVPGTCSVTQVAVTLCHACSPGLSQRCTVHCRFIWTNYGGSSVICDGLFKQLPEALQAELSPMNVVSGKREAPRARLYLTGHRELTLRHALLRFPVCVCVFVRLRRLCVRIKRGCMLVWLRAGVAACWCGWSLFILHRNLDVDGCRRSPVHRTCGYSTCCGK